MRLVGEEEMTMMGLVERAFLARFKSAKVGYWVLLRKAKWQVDVCQPTRLWSSGCSRLLSTFFKGSSQGLDLFVHNVSLKGFKVLIFVSLGLKRVVRDKWLTLALPPAEDRRMLFRSRSSISSDLNLHACQRSDVSNFQCKIYLSAKFAVNNIDFILSFRLRRCPWWACLYRRFQCWRQCFSRRRRCGIPCWLLLCTPH